MGGVGEGEIRFWVPPLFLRLPIFLFHRVLQRVLPERAIQYLNLTKEEGMNWGMMRGIWSSVADLHTGSAGLLV